MPRGKPPAVHLVLRDVLGQTGTTRIRPTRIAAPETAVRISPNGAIYLQSRRRLGTYPPRITEPLERWARDTPDRPFLVQRDTEGGWRSLTYGETLARVRRVAQALLDRRLSIERPLMILSGNSIEHALIALAAMHAGVLYTPIAPAYSLQARDYGTLGEIFERVRPALVFAAEGALYGRALQSVLPPGVEIVVESSSPDGLASTAFAELEQTPETAAVDAANGLVGPDTIAKILFTSGSTGHPKGVINTQRMLCSNQEMIRSVLMFLADEPPVLCDWLPWNHTAGGNHNFGLVLYNGGTFYIDDGRPTPAGIEATVRNLREVAATAHFTVPRTYEMLLPYLRADAGLRTRFFSQLKIFFYAAAGLTQRVFDELQELAVQTCGERLLWVTGLGSTETAPFAMCTCDRGAWAGFVGFPVPGMELTFVAPTLRPVSGATTTERRHRSTKRATIAWVTPCGLSIRTIPARGSCSMGVSPRISSSRAAPGSASDLCARRYWRRPAVTCRTSSSRRRIGISRRL
jgi:feruloyl-CoA synthase